MIYATTTAQCIAMTRVLYNDIHPLAPIQAHEIRYLRESLGWSQAKLAQFLSRDRATVSRWESGQLAPDEIQQGVLHGLWNQVYGPYAGPYQNMYIHESVQPPETGKSDELLKTIGTALLVGGVAFFIAKGLMIDPEEEES